MSGEPEPIRGIEVRPDVPKKRGRGRPKKSEKTNGKHHAAAETTAAVAPKRRGRKPGFSPKKAAAAKKGGVGTATINGELYIHGGELQRVIKEANEAFTSTISRLLQ